jgi:transcriptional regulator of acetoin/glycerol metabolism
MTRRTLQAVAAERAEILAALARCQGPYAVRRAAKELGMCERSLWRRIKMHGITGHKSYEANSTVTQDKKP